MKQLEKEINVTSRKNMMKRYKMYGATVSKLTEKSQNDTKKGKKEKKLLPKPLRNSKYQENVLENFIKNAKNRNDMGYVQGIP